MQARTTSVLVAGYGGGTSGGRFAEVSVPAEPWGDHFDAPQLVTEAEAFAYVRRHPRMSDEDLAAELGFSPATIRQYRATAERQRRHRLATTPLEDAHPTINDVQGA